MHRIVRLASEVDDLPTLEQVDAMLGELRQIPAEQRTPGLVDELLDYRSLLTGMLG